MLNFKIKWVLGIVFLILVPLISFAAQPQWSNICPDSAVSYCDNIGKNAYNNSTNPPALRGIKLGKSIGVSWRPKGSLIGISEAIPSAGIPGSIRTSPRNAYYYIIDDGSGNPFLRQCREISPQFP